MKSIFFAVVPVLLASSLAQAQHLHISVGVSSGQLQMATYGVGAHYDATSGYLVDGSNSPLVAATLTSYSATGAGGAGVGGSFASSPVIYGNAFTLTTDYYTSSESPAFANIGGVYDKSVDPMGGGAAYPDVIYKLISLTPLNGAAATNQLAYNVPTNTTGEPQHQVAYAQTGSAAASNTLDYGYGNHIHGVQLFSLQPGLYALGIVAHDNTGRFTDSTPAYFEVSAVPEPAGLSVVALAVVGAMRRRRV